MKMTRLIRIKINVHYNDKTSIAIYDVLKINNLVKNICVSMVNARKSLNIQ